VPRNSSIRRDKTAALIPAGLSCETAVAAELALIPDFAAGETS
jgi:hypothetical protein